MIAAATASQHCCLSALLSRFLLKILIQENIQFPETFFFHNDKKQSVFEQIYNVGEAERT